MMRTTLHRRYSLLLPLLVAAALIAGGCSDNFTDDVAGQEDKLRNPELLEQALVEDAGKGGRGGYKGKGRTSDQAAPDTAVAAGGPRYQLIVGYKVARRYETAGATKVTRRYKVVRRFEGTTQADVISVSADSLPQVVTELSQDQNVTYIEPDIELALDLQSVPAAGSTGQVLPWGVDLVEADVSSVRAGDGQGSVPVDVYVIDSGVSSPDLNVVEHVDFTGQGTQDDYGHGTHVAGTIAALDNASGAVGTAPGARIHSLKVMGYGGQGRISNVLAAVEYVAGQKRLYPERPMVVNLSAGYDAKSSDYTALDQAIHASIAQGIHYVIAAGNSYENVITFSPAHVDGAITVGAYNAQRAFASFSNHGPGVDILAPGANVLSLSHKGGLTLMSGTSMAAPHVTGAVAVALARYPMATPQQVSDGLRYYGREGIGQVPARTTSTSLDMRVF